MSNITEFYNLISEKREELQTLRFTPVNNREKDFIKKMRNAKKEIREARIKISKILSCKEVK